MSNHTARLCNELNVLIEFLSVWLLQLDLAVELHVDLQSGNLQPDGCRKRLGARDFARRDGFGDRLFDLSLRADADHLEKLPDAEVECLVLHRDLHSFQAPGAGATTTAVP